MIYNEDDEDYENYDYGEDNYHINDDDDDDVGNS